MAVVSGAQERLVRAPRRATGKVRRRRWLLLPIGLVGTWGGLAVLIGTTGPETPEARWLFFGLLFLAVSLAGTAVFSLLSFRLYPARRQQGTLGHACLQGLPVGLILATAAWFQSLQALTLTSGLILIGILAALEVILLPKPKC